MDESDGPLVCGHCGRVYNEFMGDRFWSGDWEVTVNGERRIYYTLCDKHHRELIRE